MKSIQQTGRLVNWHPDREFGFIKPDQGNEEVFFHISVLKKTDRCPQVGDRIVFEAMPLPGQKLRAVNASIGGMTLSSVPTQRKTVQWGLLKPVGGVAILCGVVLLYVQLSPSHYQSVTASVIQPVCLIKGNISSTIDQHMYYLPDMDGYESTLIDATTGERWFCTESEAIQNGWRKAPR